MIDCCRYVTEFVNGGEFMHYIREQEGGILQSDVCTFYMAELVLGLDYLHSRTPLPFFSPPSFFFWEWGRGCFGPANPPTLILIQSGVYPHGGLSMM